jgi:hypothetical protein
MGWRTQQVYEDAERESEKQWRASLSWSERIRLRVAEVASVAGLIFIVIGFVGLFVSR